MKLPRPYNDPEVDLTGFTIRNLEEWEPGLWSCTVSQPDDKPLMFWRKDSFADTIYLGVGAKNREEAIHIIRKHVVQAVLEQNAKILAETERAIRRGLREDVAL